jgi:membrane-bound ClpP family serine protease
MIGLIGMADNEIFSSGRVKVRGEYWSARSASPVPAGRPVKVMAVDNMTLKVEEVKE